MVSKGDDGFVLWPRYFDASLSRAQGRRVPAKLAVKKPDVKWLESAAKKAGLSLAVEEDARHPAAPFQVEGRVIVQGADSKEAAIRHVAAKMAASTEAT